ncbi:MAG: hypothetical protein R3C46_02565 [Hyphomonadaceae bacterium]
MRGTGLAAGFAGIVLLAAVGAAPALAQDVDKIDRITGTVGPGGSFRPPEGVKVVTPGALVFASFDSNFDGQVMPDELIAGAQHAFRAADSNGDGSVTGFEQSDWAARMGDPTGLLANAMTFDIDLDRSVKLEEFTTGLRRIADQLADESGIVKFTDLIQPLNRQQDQNQAAGPGFGWGTLTGRGSPPRENRN